MVSVLALRQLLARGLGATVNFDKIIRAHRGRYVLAYHRVISNQQAKIDGVHHTMWITPKSLDSQICWMRSIGEIVEYSRIVDTSVHNDKPLFSITFDDGWKDNYEQAFPILKKYQVPAVVFLATDAINSGELFWPEDISTKTRRILSEECSSKIRTALYDCWPEHSFVKVDVKLDAMEMVERWIEALKMVDDNERWHSISDYYRRLRLSSTPLMGYVMNWNEAREMHKHGISFGSHTHHHTILKGLPPERIESELKQSRSLIADKMQIEVDSFCYPNARYNGNERTILSRCGYRYGFCLNNKALRPFTDNFYIPRFLVSERTWTYPAHFKLRLLEVPLYRSKPHNPNSEQP